MAATVALAGCAGKSATLVATPVGDLKVLTCAPAVRYDGYTVTVDGLQVPGTGKTPVFTIAKVGMSPQVVRSISETTTRYKNLVDETCKSLILLAGDTKLVESYSTHRDSLLSTLITYLDRLNNSSTDADAQKATADAQKSLTTAGSKPTP
jgi:hypothetical protein